MSKEKIKIKEPVEEPISQEGKVGTMLRDVRVKKKIVIDDVAEKLRIKSAYLVAIENSDYANIPAAPYGTGFIRSYASYLGLNSERIVQIFKEELSPTTQTLAPSNTPIENDEIIAETDSKTINHKYIITSVALLILCYLLWLTITPNSNNEISSDSEISTITKEDNKQDYPLQVENFTEEFESVVETGTIEETPQITVTDAVFVDEDENKEKTSDEKVSKDKTLEEKAPEEKVIATPEQKSEKTEKTDKSEKETKIETENKNESTNVVAPKKTGRVILKIKKETWIEVKDENKLWISKVLQAGDEYVLPENGVGKTVSFGNTDGVDVVIDGKIVTVISNNKKTNINMDAFLGNH